MAWILHWVVVACSPRWLGRLPLRFHLCYKNQQTFLSTRCKLFRAVYASALLSRNGHFGRERNSTGGLPGASKEVRKTANPNLSKAKGRKTNILFNPQHNNVPTLLKVFHISSTSGIHLCVKITTLYATLQICAYTKVAYLFDHPGTVFYAVFMSFWGEPTPPRLFSTAVTFLEYWKRKNASLAHQWDCMGFQEEDEKPRPEFAANAPYLEENPITGVSFVVIVLVDFGSGARAFLPQRSEVSTNRSRQWAHPPHG